MMNQQQIHPMKRAAIMWHSLGAVIFIALVVYMFAMVSTSSPFATADGHWVTPWTGYVIVLGALILFGGVLVCILHGAALWQRAVKIDPPIRQD